jgi:murein DD-endopeptidase MepM/ murein hydrolase activator NlpD
MVGQLGGWTARGAIGFLGVLVVLAPLACSRVVYHRVRPGENLYRIGKAYGVSAAELARVNQLADPSRLEVGQELRIPGARGQLPVNVITPKSASLRRPSAGERPPAGASLGWPVSGGTVSSTFGQRGNSFHDGIDISATAGTPVRAAAAGEVIYSDVLRGYGNVIIVRHDDGYATVYAHNERNLAPIGKQVRRGEVIAKLGDSGHTSGANLHFEVRKDNVARNPLFFLSADAALAMPERGLETSKTSEE